MGHDCFISYSSVDKPAADAACAVLERNGIRCWIAPRDIVAGRTYAEAIVEAINGSTVMVLVFSGHANASAQVSREVERAIAKAVVVVPFRIEDIAPSRSMEYYLSTPHWLDAFPPPMERHLERLAENVATLLARGTADSARSSRPQQVLRERSVTRRFPALKAAVLLAIVALVTAGVLASRHSWPFQASCEDRAADYPEMDGTRVTAFHYRAADPNQTSPDRAWSRPKPDLWMERSADQTNWLSVVKRAHVATCDGTIVAQEQDTNLQVFIADRNCRGTSLKFRRAPSCTWNSLAAMTDVE